FVYKCTDYYNPTAEISLRWDDPDIGIEWPSDEVPIRSLKDSMGKKLKDVTLL
ncbi:dTDP-4-dehydrorhamnose 3,5-epimerase family protein, partial [Vibrio cholerae]